MNILILGGGGREHSLAWAVKQNPKCERLIVAPGNAGIAQIAECADISITDGGSVVQYARHNAIDLVIIGPEAPLVSGVGDACRAAGILCLGPSASAARLESSKYFTKEICAACDAPTASYAVFEDLAGARAYIDAHPMPIVIKADGLAAGKGVFVCANLNEAHAALEIIFSGELGAAGERVVIEEFMDGEEASLFVLCDGESSCLIGTAQDHKRIGEGDTGPNTGGMGAYSPAAVLSHGVLDKAMAEIVEPVLAEMDRRGTPFHGVLYVGLMIKDGAPRLVEFNVRFGDPECQVLMMRLGGQALDLMQACAEGRLSEIAPQWADDHAMTVVMAAKGYPGSYQKGSAINGLDALAQNTHQMMFHAGTALSEGQFVAAGGRVLNATCRGQTLREARDRAYEMIEQVDWSDGVYRGDIGWRAL